MNHVLTVRCLTIVVAVMAALVAPTAVAAEERVSVSHLPANGLEDPLGIGGEAPRLSWRLDSDDRGVRQTAYQVRVPGCGTAAR